MKNKNYRKLLTTFLVVVVISCIYLYVSANEEQQNYYDVFVGARAEIGIIQSEINSAKIPLNQLAAIQSKLVEALGEYKSNSRRNVLKSFIDRAVGSFAGAAKTLVDQLSASMSSYGLINSLDAVNVQIDEYIAEKIDKEIYQREETGYNATYDRVLEYYGLLTGQKRINANVAVFGRNTDADLSQEIANMKWGLPDATKVYVSPCATPTGTCIGYYTDANEHKLECKQKMVFQVKQT